MTETPSKKTAPRWMKIVLTISLALNLLIIGAVGAKFFMPHHPNYGKGPHGALARPDALYKAGRHLMWKLSRQRRREMFQLVRMHRSNMKAELSDLATARLTLARTIANHPDDQKRFDENWQLVKKAESALFVKASALTADFIKNLTPDERKTYAEILQNPPRRKWFRKRPSH